MYRITLSRGKGTALVDDCDADLAEIGPWFLSDGYAKRNAGRGADRRTERLHMVVARRVYGAALTGLLVDHRNGDRLDCRRANLRPATRSQQQANRRRRSLGGEPTPYKGVSFHRQSGTWRAELRHKGVYRHLGHFATDAEAARAYDAAARALYGEYARCNFPE